MKKILKTVIIGAGKMGAFFDSPNSENIFSHAHAVLRHKNFQLVGFIDKDLNQAKKASDVWGGDFFDSVEECFKKTNFDVAVVSVGDVFHFDVLKKVASLPLKAVFAEKPLAVTLKDAQEIVDLYEEKKIPLLVNYTRRFVLEFSHLREQIKNGDFGKFIFGNSFYGKGVLHSATHHFDLLNFFLGKFELKTVFNKRNDFYEDDPSVAAIYDFNGSNFVLNFIGEEFYTYFEMNLFFEKKRIRISDLGFLVEEFDAQKSPYFEGYTNLIKTKEYKVGLNNALFYGYENLKNLVFEKDFPVCSAKDAFFALKIGLETLNEAKK